jgi:hypothetical protein
MPAAPAVLAAALVASELPQAKTSHASEPATIAETTRASGADEFFTTDSVSPLRHFLAAKAQ